MKNVFMLVVSAAVCLLLSTVAFADGAEPSAEEPESIQQQTEEVSIMEEEVSTEFLELLLEEINALQAEVQELRVALATLQASQPERIVSIGVLPIENSGRIPEIRESFREVIVSALNEAGIHATESLDEETLRWVQRQDQLVRERWIDPLSAPPRGELQGVSHFLLATVTSYQENVTNKDECLGGFLVLEYDDIRWREVTLSVDFRVIDARTGIVEGAFQTETFVWNKEVRGLIVKGPEQLPLAAVREVARQAAERIAGLFTAPTISTQPEEPTS